MDRDRAIREFKKQLAEVVPGKIRKAEDLLQLPEHIMRRVRRQLEGEEMDEALRSRGKA